MNLLSISILVLVWALIAIVLFINIYKKKETYNRLNVTLLVLIGFLISIYIRYGVYPEHTFAPGDEIIHQFTYNRLLLSKDFSKIQSSGPGFMILLYCLHELIGSDLPIIFTHMSLFFSSITPIAVFLLIKEMTGETQISAGTTLLTLCSSFFIWNMIEVRPEQIAMVLLFLALQQIHSYSKKSVFSIEILPLTILIFGLSMIHMLSNIFFLYMLMCVILYFYVSKKTAVIGQIALFTPLVLWFVAFIISFSLSGVLYDIQYVFLKSKVPSILSLTGGIMNLPWGIILFYPLLLPVSLSVLFLILFTLTARKYQKVICVSLQRLLAHGASGRIILSISLATITILASTLLHLHISDITVWYSSITEFLYLQGGNIILALLSVLGVHMSLKNKCISNYLVPFSILAILSTLFVVNIPIGYFLSMRTIDYAIVFISFFAFLYLSRLKGNSKNIILISIILLFPGSLIVSSRDPDFINQRAYWHWGDEWAIMGWSKNLISQQNIYASMPNEIHEVLFSWGHITDIESLTNLSHSYVERVYQSSENSILIDSPVHVQDNLKDTRKYPNRLGLSNLIEDGENVDDWSEGGYYPIPTDGLGPSTNDDYFVEDTNGQYYRREGLYSMKLKIDVNKNKNPDYKFANWYTRNVPPLDKYGESGNLSFWMYIPDPSALDDDSKFGATVIIAFFSDETNSKFHQFVIRREDLSTGWKKYDLNFKKEFGGSEKFNWSSIDRMLITLCENQTNPVDTYVLIDGLKLVSETSEHYPDKFSTRG